MRAFITLTTLCFSLALGVAVQARHQVELESTYLGDGWFEYRLRSVYDPYFLFFDLGFLSIKNFPGYEQMDAEVPDWQGEGGVGINGPYVGWNFTNCSYVACQTVPYERAFRARSQFQTFKTGRMGGVFGMSLSLRGGYHGTAASVNIVGFASADVLIPCDPSEADNSPTNLLIRQSLGLPDPQIAGLVRSGTDITGVTLTYSEASTMLLQGSFDFQTWENIAYIYGNAPSTTWTSSTPLNSYGSFFRLLLVAEGHTLFTNDFATATAPRAAKHAPSPNNGPTSSQARVLSCRPGSSGVAVEVQTAPGARYAVNLVNRRGEPLQQRIIDGSTAITTVTFTFAPTSALFATVAPLAPASVTPSP